MNRKLISGLCLCVCFIFSNCKKNASNEDLGNTESKNSAKVSVGGTLKVPVSPGDLGTSRHLTQSPDYDVYVKRNGESDTQFKKCFVYKTDNYFIGNSATAGGNSIAPRPQTAASFTNFSFGSTWVDIKIVFKTGTANTVTMRPKNLIPTKTIYYNKSGNTVTFTLRSAAKLSIEVNDRNHPLFIFGNELEVPPTSATYYYKAPGIYNLGTGYKTINNGESVYIEAGAVVEGSFKIAWGANNVSIKGQGIINNGLKGTPTHTDLDYGNMQQFSTIQGKSTNNTVIDGITITNSRGWTLQMEDYEGNNHHNTYSNLKLINWNISTDGIWFDGNYNTVDNCFIFNNDDLLMTHGSNNCVIKNTTLWGGAFGNIFMQMSHSPSNFVTYDNINVIGKDGVEGMSSQLIEVWNTTSNDTDINNLTFKNIRVEDRKASTVGFIKLTPGTQNLSNWTFENFTIDGNKRTNEGVIYGNANAPISNIKFINFKLGGTNVYSLGAANILTNSYVSNVTFQ